MIAKKELNYDVLLESAKEEVDHHYNYLKSKGWFDFVDDFILPNQEKGVRIDKELNYSNTIQANYIRCENTPNLLGQIKMMRDL
ncbi:hypothetical protein CL634_01775 [bacterium]|nr:hypothetical protein [bacterium]